MDRLAVLGVWAFNLCNRHRWHIKQKNKPWKHTKQIIFSFALRHLCPVHEVLAGIWKPLIFTQIVISFGQGKCTYYASGNHVSTSSCMLIKNWDTDQLMWTFHTNSLLHEYLFLMRVHKYNYINTFINDLVFFTVIIQC